MKLLILLLALVITPSLCFAHDAMLLKCSKALQKTGLKKLGEDLLPNGMLVEAYDANGDGKPDVETVSIVTGTDDKGIQHREFPVLYWLDLQNDGNVDLILIDKFGDGQCDSIVLYTNDPAQLSRHHAAEIQYHHEVQHHE